MNILKHMSPKAFKAMSAAGKAVTVLSAAGIVAGAGLLLISLNEGSVRSSADSQEIVARQKADASINAALGTEIGARLAGDAAATRASSDYTNDGIAKEALARQSALSLETAARQKVIADESGARQQAVAAESATARQYTDSAVATEAAARQQSIPAALATANSFTTTALTKETADRQTAITALQAAVQTASASGQQSASAASATARQYTDSAVATEAAARTTGLNTVTAAVDTERTARQAASAATLTSAQQYADGKITSLQVYALSSVNIAVPTADSPTFFVWTSVCSPGDIAISGGLVYDYSRLATGVLDAQTQAGVVRSEPDITDPTKKTWIWALRNTAVGSKNASFTLLCLDLTP